jgi:hypothetical protein
MFQHLVLLFSCISIFALKSNLQKQTIFAYYKIAKEGVKLLTFVKMARNADLDFAEK